MMNPRPEMAREFWINIIMLGELAYDSYLAEVRAGDRITDFAELNEIKGHIATCRAELAKIK